MIVSHKHKFVFIRPQKVGGTSLENAIDQLDPDSKSHDISSKKYIQQNTGYNLDPHHIPGVSVKKLMKHKNYKKFFKFSFTRNPWDRMVSLYKYLNKMGCSNTQSCTLKEFIQQGDNSWWFGAFDNHIDFIGTVDFIGRVETLQEDFDFICKKIGIPSVDIPHKNKTIHAHYSEYYDQESRDLVASRFEKDIRYFGYKFG